MGFRDRLRAQALPTEGYGTTSTWNQGVNAPVQAPPFPQPKSQVTHSGFASFQESLLQSRTLSPLGKANPTSGPALP